MLVAKQFHWFSLDKNTVEVNGYSRSYTVEVNQHSSKYLLCSSEKSFSWVDDDFWVDYPFKDIELKKKKNLKTINLAPILKKVI